MLQPFGDDAVVGAVRHLNHKLVGNFHRVDFGNAQFAGEFAVEARDALRTAVRDRALLDGDDVHAALCGGAESCHARDAQACDYDVAFFRFGDFALVDFLNFARLVL